MLKKITVYVVRHKNETTLGSSSPCQECHDKMKMLNIKRIVYSDDNGIISTTPDKYQSYGTSIGRKYIENNYEFSSRN